MSEPKLLLRNIQHRFGDQEVLRGIDFDLYPGEIHALVGERQSGKSTLARIISGDLRKQAGHIYIDGREVNILSPRDGLAHRIGIIYEHLSIMPGLGFLENVYSSRLPVLLTPGRRRSLEARCRRILDQFGLELDTKVRLDQLHESDQQLVELLRFFVLDLDILILDGIANRRTPAQMAKVVKLLRHLREQGKALVYITSNVDEVFQLADRVTVIKDGLRQSTERVQDLDRLRLISLAYSFALRQDQGERQPASLSLDRFNEELLQRLPTGAILLDAAGRVTLANSVVEKLAPRLNGELRQRALGDLLDAIGIAARDEVLEAQQRRTSRTWERLDYGRGRALRLKISPLWDQEAFQGTILFLDDVSIEHQVKEYLSRADQVASIAELAAGVAHEINNPLAILQNYLILCRLPASEAERAENLRRMEGELQRIVEIVESLLSFSRVNQTPLKRVNVAKLFEEVLILLSHKLGEKEIAVTRHWPATPVVLTVIENKIKQLFINLVVNAFEAVLQQGRIRIEIEQKPATGYAEIRINDNGYGIAPEIQPQIFTPFFTTKASRTNSGLGLTICQHIAELHGGVLLFESVPGDTTFTVRLPLQ
jgi:two-component system sensor histidine kinase AtoS